MQKPQKKIKTSSLLRLSVTFPRTLWHRRHYMAVEQSVSLTLTLSLRKRELPSMEVHLARSGWATQSLSGRVTADRVSLSPGERAGMGEQSVSCPTVSLRGPCSGHETQNFARFAFGDDLERAAADFTIRGKPLRRDAGVDDQLKPLPAERALNVRRHFHGTIGLRRCARRENPLPKCCDTSQEYPRRRRSIGERMMDYFSFSMPSNSTSNTSVAFGPMTGSGMRSP